MEFYGTKLSDEGVKRRFSVKLSSIYEEALTLVVDEGFYLNPQGAIRAGLRLLFKFHGYEAFIDKGAGFEKKDIE